MASELTSAEPVDPSVFGCAPFHGDACEGVHDDGDDTSEEVAR